MTYDPEYLFTLRFRLSAGVVTIRAWEAPPFKPNGDPQYPGRTHTRIDAELRWKAAGGKSEVIFPRGATYCGVPGHTTVDGNAARELVTSLFAIRPGDTDEEYFASYTPKQLGWAEVYGEELGYLKDNRYCDPEIGSVRS
jgi:hypothetical protein